MSSSSFPYLPGHTALLIIDMQHYFTQSGSIFARFSGLRLPGQAIASYFERLDARVIPNIQALQRSFRDRGDPVFYTCLGSNRPQGSDLPAWARRLNAAGLAAFGSPVVPGFDEPGAELDSRMAPLPEESILGKTTTGALASTPLEAELRARRVRSVVVAGVLSALCVGQTARELADRDFDVALAGDACTSLTEAAHEAALSAFGAVYGWVLQTSEILDFKP